MTETTKRDERGSLLPCPFCGSRLIGLAYTGQPARQIFASCFDCTATGPAQQYSTGMTFDWDAAWNRRASLATAPEQTGEPAITQCWSTTDGTRCDNCGRGLSAHIDQRWCDPASTNRLTGEQIEALRIAADALIERYAAPIRAIIAATEGK